MVSQICAAIARDGKASLKRQHVWGWDGRTETKCSYKGGQWLNIAYWMAVGAMFGAILPLAWLLWEVYWR